MGLTTGYKRPNGTDIGTELIEKSYLFDRYPELADSFKQSGLWVWGRNDEQALGDGTTASKSSPVQTAAGGNNWKQVSGGSSNGSGIKTDGTLWTWGLGFSGTMGDNTNSSRTSPVQTISGGTNWKQVACGSDHIAAIKTDGTLWTWGQNTYGQLGDNSTTNRSSPVQTIASGTNWKQVACGSYLATAAIKTDGTLWSWGYNADGDLGDNSITNKSSPVQTVSGGTNWRFVGYGRGQMGGIKTDGTLWMWGRNDFGQLGDNTRVKKSSPVQTVSGGTNWLSFASSLADTTAAIKTDGTLWLWGNGSALGNNDSSGRSSPVQTISGGTNWKQISIGFHAVALKTDGTLWTWGSSNSFGQLGNNTTTSSVSPIQTISGGSNWRSVASGSSTTLAIRDSYDDLI